MPDHVSFWSRVFESSPLIVILLLVAIAALAWFIRYLMRLLEARDARFATTLEARDDRFADLQSETLTALAENTGAVRELRDAIRNDRK